MGSVAAFVNIEATGTGKTEALIADCIYMIQNTDRRRVIYVQEKATGNDIAKRINTETGSGANFYGGYSVPILDSVREEYRHELTAPLDDKDFQKDQVVIITHAKAQKIFNGLDRNEKLSGIFNTTFDDEVIDEHLLRQESLVITADDLFRLEVYNNFSSHAIDAFWEMLKTRVCKGTGEPLDDIISEEFSTTHQTFDQDIDTNVLQHEIDRHYDRKISRKEFRKDVKKKRKIACKKYGYEENKAPKSKGADNLTPLDFEQMANEFVSYEKYVAIRPYNTMARSALVCRRDSVSAIPITTMLDATYNILPKHMRDRTVIEPKVKRDYSNTTLFTMVFDKKTNNIASRLKQVVKEGCLKEGKTLLAATKSAMNEKDKTKEGKTTREVFEGLGKFHTTHFGADKGTNKFRDDTNVVILNTTVEPAFLDYAYEYITGGEYTAAMRLQIAVVQLVNRGCCRLGAKDGTHPPMNIILPRKTKHLMDVLRTYMPNIQIAKPTGNDKMQLLEKFVSTLKEDVVVLRNQNVDGFSHPKELQNFISKYKTETNALFKASEFAYGYGKLKRIA